MKNTYSHVAGLALGHSSYEALDRLALVEMRPYGMSQRLLPHLYNELRQPGMPAISRQAAEAIAARPHAPVTILTGMQIPNYMPVGETDGPVGAIVLAAGLTHVGHDVAIVVEPEIKEVMDQVIAELEEFNLPEITIISSSDTQAYRAREEETEIAIAIEKLGANSKAVRHSVGGTAVSTGDDYADTFITNLQRNGGFTIGVGDNGNEIGFGKIASFAQSIVPWGNVCRCDCSSGIITTTPTDLVIPCAVSNYGAYVIMTALACLLEREDLLINPNLISALVQRFVSLGMVNGAIEDDPDFVGDDGIPLSGVEAFAELFRLIGSHFFTRVGDHR